MIKACQDKVPNVQFCVAKILHSNKSVIDSGVFSSLIAPKLKDMIQDGDRDVAFYATAAFKD